MTIPYFALVHSLTACSNELTHHSELKGMMEVRKEEPKSCTSETATADKIVVALGEESAVGMVTVITT